MRWMKLEPIIQSEVSQKKNTSEGNQRRHKWMEKYTLFMDQKNQYSENEYTTQSNL